MSESPARASDVRLTPFDNHSDALLGASIKRELREIQPLKLPPDWPDDARFVDDLGLDSLDLVEMVAHLEQSTSLFVPDADLSQLTSVTTTIAYVRHRQAESGVTPVRDRWGS